MKKIKVLRIIARLNIGGPAIHVVLLTKGLNKNKFDSTLVCGSLSKAEGDMSYYASQRQVSPVVLAELKRELSILGDLKACWKIYLLIRKVGPDIIHTHTAKAGALGRQAGMVYNLTSRKKAKLVHTFHGHVLEGYFGRLRSLLFILVEKYLACFSDKIITVSGQVKEELVSLGIARKDKIEVIPLGFELDNFLSISSRQDDDVFRIGIIGRLVPIKNHYLFLEAARHLLKLKPEGRFEFLVIGDGELRGSLIEYAGKLNLGANVKFMGWQNYLVPVYAGLDVVALTSKNEGTPVSLIEAMAAARAVVTTDVGGVRDLLGRKLLGGAGAGVKTAVLERGLVVASGDAESFASALRLLYEDRGLRIKMGASGRNFVAERFSKERLISDIETLYYSIL